MLEILLSFAPRTAQRNYSLCAKHKQLNHRLAFFKKAKGVG